MNEANRAPATRSERRLVWFENVDVVVAGRTVLHRITWGARMDEHWAVVGANGSGKTSFLKLVAGSLAPAGIGLRRYDFGSGVQTDAVEAQHHIALVGHELQDRYRRLHWNFSSLEVVLSGIFRTDVPRRDPTPSEERHALALLDELHALEHAERPFLELSRGMQRRVLLARSLGVAPKILLLDEAAAGLDQETRRVLEATIERVSRDTMIIYTNHDVGELPGPINRVLKLAKGHIEEAGPLRRRPPGRNVRPKAEPAQTVPAPPPRVGDDAAATKASDASLLIDVEHADVWFDDRRILTDLTWRHRRGEHWLVLGANGAGKSTFLRLLHGQVRPAKGGSIHWPALGDPRSVWTLRRQVAWVSPELQSAYLYPTSVRDCIASGFDSSIGLMRRPSEAQTQWVETLLQRFELVELAERPVAALSYGQMRRVLIARALVNEPKLLLLDEPWEGLDGATLELLRRHLELIVAHGTHLICTSHIQRDVTSFTHELELADGRIVRALPRAPAPLKHDDDGGALRES